RTQCGQGREVCGGGAPARGVCLDAAGDGARGGAAAGILAETAAGGAKAVDRGRRDDGPACARRGAVVRAVAEKEAGSGPARTKRRDRHGLKKCGVRGSGTPDRSRTCDLRLRRATLYPAELLVPEE